MIGQIFFSLPLNVQKNLNWFKFKLLHRILPTNNNVHKKGLVNSPLCYLCQHTLETIEHISAECFIVRDIWIEVEIWILEEHTNKQ